MGQDTREVTTEELRDKFDSLSSRYLTSPKGALADFEYRMSRPPSAWRRFPTLYRIVKRDRKGNTHVEKVTDRKERGRVKDGIMRAIHMAELYIEPPYPSQAPGNFF
jgi:hypothetical protein